jgi:hypothetical protein
MASSDYIAHGIVRETGAVLTERIAQCRDAKFALRVAEEWAHENAIKLVLVEQVRPVWVRNGISP